jgi:hypothetical protein
LVALAITALVAVVFWVYTQTQANKSNISDALRKNYSSQNQLSLLVPTSSNIKIPIGKITVRLADIDETEQKEDTHGLSEDERFFTEQFSDRKQKMTLDNLLEHKSVKDRAEKRILIQGAPGMGKSTLCHLIAYRWGKEEIFQEFDYLLLLHLNHLDTNKYKYQQLTLEKYLADEAGLKETEVRDLLEKDKKKKTLIVLDGYDQLTPDAADERGRFYGIVEELKKFPNVIITSRQQVANFNKNCTLKILGLDWKGIKSYIHQFFNNNEDKAKNLQRYLKQHSSIQQLVHTPMYLEIFCCLAENGNPFTEEHVSSTAIYMKLTEWLCKRFIINRSKELQLPEAVKEESNPENHPSVTPIIQALEKIAWKIREEGGTDRLPKDAICEIYQAIDPQEKNSIKHLKDIGIIKVEGEQGVFIHPTFQEYFAALYLTRLYKDSPEKAKEFVRNHKFEPHYQSILPMVAGILSKKGKADIFFDDFLLNPKDEAKSFELFLMAKCFHECIHPKEIRQHKTFIQNVVDHISAAPNIAMIFQLIESRSFSPLLHHPHIVDIIVDNLENKDKQVTVIQFLKNIVQTELALPDRLVESLNKLHNDKTLDSSINFNIYTILIELNKSNKYKFLNLEPDLPTKSLDILKEMSKSVPAHLKTIVQEGSCEKLAKIALNAGEDSQAAIDCLLKILMNPSLYVHLRAKAANALGHVGKTKSISLQKIVEPLIKELTQTTLQYRREPPLVRISFISSMLKIAKAKPEQSQKIHESILELACISSMFLSNEELEIEMKALEKISKTNPKIIDNIQDFLIEKLTDSIYDLSIRKSAAITLGKMAQRKMGEAKKIQNALMTIVNSNANNDFRALTIQALGSINTYENPEETYQDLLKILLLSVSSTFLQAMTVNELTKIAEIRSFNLHEPLMKILLDPRSPLDKEIIADAIGRNVGKNPALAQEIEVVLVKNLSNKNNDEKVRTGSIYALGKMAETGHPLSDATLKVISEPDIANLIINNSIIYSQIIKIAPENILLRSILLGAFLLNPLLPIASLSQPALETIFSQDKTTSKDTFQALVSMGMFSPSHSNRECAAAILSQMTLPQLEFSEIDNFSLTQLKNFCYLTNKALVIEENVVTISDEKNKRSFTLIPLNANVLKKILNLLSYF